MPDHPDTPHVEGTERPQDPPPVAGKGASGAPPHTLSAPRDAAQEREFFRGLARLVGALGRAALGPLLILAVWLVATWLYALPTRVTATPALALLIPLGLRLVRALTGGLFAQGPERLVPCDDATARHFRRYLRALGSVASILAPVIWILEVNRYPPGAADAVWLALELALILLLALTVARRGLLTALLPKSETRLGTAAHSVARIVYPFVAAYLLAILAIQGLGYQNLARYLGRSTALSALVLLAAYIAWKFVAFRLDVWLESHPAPPPDAEPGSEPLELASTRRTIHAAGEMSARLLLLAGVAFAILLSWGLDWAATTDLVFATWVVHWDGGVDFGEVGLAPSEIYAILVYAALAFFGSKLARHFSRRWLRAASGLDRGTQDALGNAAGVLVAGFGAYGILTTLHANLEALKWLGGAVGLGLGFGLQNIVNNFVSGLILLVEKPVRTDDIIELEGGVTGRVQQIGTRSTVLIDSDNIARIVPNSDLIQKSVTNWTHNDPIRRIHVDVGVKYGSEVQLVRRILLETAGAHGNVLKRPPPEVYFEEFGGDALQFCLTCFIDLKNESARARRIRSDLRFALEAAFRKHGIEIPFPQRDLHLASAVPLVHRVVIENGKQP